ncbi:MAG TPA: type II toxin-antitoxin system PemK/MazF family toxin [Acidimicrobiales bacterium]|nr:type II toxin-antitoxin system PemK/MazF family toxin [Acidimicrobiales bacterium]
MPTSGEVVLLDLGVPQGREAGFPRPAVVITADRILAADPSVVHVVPLSSTLRRFESEVVVEPSPANGLGSASAAQCQHLRSVSPSRIAGTLGNVGPVVLAQVRETVAVLLDLPG